MRNIKLTIEYDGTNYVGWQRQLNGKSIQGEIEYVLHQILQEEITLIGAGRTDAGVHARGQVANFKNNSQLTPFQIKSALNGNLPEDIAITNIEEVQEEFHARFDATERWYSYTITTVPTALDRLYSWYLRYEMQIEAMQQAAAIFIGKHDFEGFAKVGSDVNNYICTVQSSRWKQEGGKLLYTISADRFLRGMVRLFVGSMVDVGRGLITPEALAEHLNNKIKYEPKTAAPASGLVLERVEYPCLEL